MVFTGVPSTSTFCLNSSIVIVPPNTFRSYRFGAFLIDDNLPCIRLRMRVMFPHMILPFVRPYASRAYDFIQLQEQKLPRVENLLRRSSYPYGSCNCSVSNG